MLTPMSVFVVFSVAALALLACVKRIPEGQAYTLRRLGGHLRTIGAGTHVVVPIVERVAHRIRLLGNVVTFERLNANGRSYDGAIYYQVLDAERADAIIDRVDGLLRSRLARLLEQAGEEDDASRNRRLKGALNEEVAERGILITRVQVAAA